MKKIINWGLLSTARINRAVIPPIRGFPFTHLYAVASRDLARAEGYAREHGIEKSYGSYQALLNDPKVDAVYVSLPNGLHQEWILKALDAGKHVLCEKSITVTLKEILEVKEAAEQSGLLVMEGFMYRYHPYFNKVLEYAHSDKIGDIQNIQVSRAAWQRNPNDIRLQPGLGPGAMGDVGCYCLNFIRTIMAEEPQRWDAIVRYNETGVDMEVAGQLAFSAPKTAQFFCSFTSNGAFANIIGSNGRVNIVEPFWVGTGEREFNYYTVDGEKKVVRVTSDMTGHALEIRDFSLAILEGRSPMLSLDDSVGNLTVLEDIVNNGNRVQG